MTVHGVTKPMTFDVTAKFGPQDVSGTATTSFMLADFNIPKPSVPLVLSIEDKLMLEIDFKANRTTA
jgi:polyisoprenoid-binding protein YceI